mmetsp:Transcript_10009/g.22180  ORF Transcript_10009/g.22180 Transcript_10009/m.22180 type:complete len:128 (-) Transcript_10009:538-921(-)
MLISLWSRNGNSHSSTYTFSLRLVGGNAGQRAMFSSPDNVLTTAGYVIARSFTYISTFSRFTQSLTSRRPRKEDPTSVQFGFVSLLESTRSNTIFIAKDSIAVFDLYKIFNARLLQLASLAAKYYHF